MLAVVRNDSESMQTPLALSRKMLIIVCTVILSGRERGEGMYNYEGWQSKRSHSFLSLLLKFPLALINSGQREMSRNGACSSRVTSMFGPALPPPAFLLTGRSQSVVHKLQPRVEQKSPQPWTVSIYLDANVGRK